MGAYEIESMFKEFEDFDDSVYRPENFAILRYCYENYEYNSDIDFGGKRHLWDHKNPYYGCGARGCEKRTIRS